MHLRTRLILAVTGAAGLLIPLMGTSGASAAAASKTPVCIVTSNPSQVETGEGATASSIVDLVQVECQPAYSEQQVEISSPQLNALCQDTLEWNGPTNFNPGESTDVTLDDDGNAFTLVWGGPSCAAGTALITADLTVAPFTTARTHFTILPPASTKEGITAAPSSLVEDSVYSDAGTVINIEFPSVYAGDTVEISSPQLADRCAGVNWVGPEGDEVGTGATAYVTLDNDGNAWVWPALIDCATGKSLITADLLAPPHTTLQTHFTILAPAPTVGPRMAASPARAGRGGWFSAAAHPAARQ